MSTIINLLLFILILGILVFVHELGHFLTAKRSGVFIHEFSIGMGPLIKSFKGKKDKIQYSIRALPLGGYVQMAGEIYEDDDTNKIPKDKFMCNKKWYQRLIILCAGVFNNFLLAIVLLFFIALIWGSTELSSKIGFVTPDSAASEAGLVAGDEITKLNGSKVSTWDDLQLLLLIQDSKEYNFEIKHENGKTETIKITPGEYIIVGEEYIRVTEEHTKEQIIEENNLDEDTETTTMIGISGDNTIHKGFISSLKYAFTKFVSLFKQMLLTLKYLFTGDISINQLSGPVGIYSVVGQTRKAGIASVLFLIAYLSINLGIMNILPIPALDGGHVLFLLIEMITRKKVNEKVESITTTIFFGLLMLLMIYITIHDVITIFF